MFNQCPTAFRLRNSAAHWSRKLEPIADPALPERAADPRPRQRRPVRRPSQAHRPAVEVQSAGRGCAWPGGTGRRPADQAAQPDICRA